MPSFDPTPYTTVPTRTPAGTMSLARALLSAARPRPDRTVAARLAKLRERAALLQVAWIETNRPEAPAEDSRPFDVSLDRAWIALHDRLAAWSKLDAQHTKPRATELHTTLFPTGLDFLQLRYASQWAQSERRLAQIAADDLVAEVEQLAGGPFLAAVRAAHAEYGRVLGITDKKADPVDPTGVIEPLQALRHAIASYARAVVGLTDEDDDQAVAAMKSQLRPLLDNRRPSTSGRPASDEAADEDDEPIEQPLPELPAEA